MNDNSMHFSHMYNSTITPIPLLDVEVYNYNYLADDQITCTSVDMSSLHRYSIEGYLYNPSFKAQC